MNMKKVLHYSVNGFQVYTEGYQKAKKFIRHGDTVLRYPSGQKALSGTYINGKPTGKWLRWYESGQMLSTHHYLSGRLHGQNIHWYENGEKARECIYENGRLDADLRIWFKNEVPSRHLVYKKGRLISGFTYLKKHKVGFDLLNDRLFLDDARWDITPEKICYVDNSGKYDCKTPEQMWHDLSTFMTPEQVAEIMAILDSLYEELGLDSTKGVLTICSGTAVVTDVRNTGPVVQERDEHNAQITQAELDSMIQACSSKAQDINAKNRTEGPNPNQTRDEWVRDTVAKTDEEIGNC